MEVKLESTLKINGITEAALAYLPKGHYILFYNAVAVDPDNFAESTCPEGITVDLVPLMLKSSQSIEDAIRIYRRDGE